MEYDKDEILRRAKIDEEREKKRLAEIERSQAPVDLKSRMPIGCWIWFALIAFAVYMLFRKYLSGV